MRRPPYRRRKLGALRVIRARSGEVATIQEDRSAVASEHFTRNHAAIGAG